MYINYNYHNGCSDKKCPCRLWVNCKKYIDDQKQQERLKKKDLDNYYKPYNEWYEDNYRNVIELGSSIPNG